MKLQRYLMGALLICCLTVSTAWAQSATDTIRVAVDEVMEIIKDPGMRNPAVRPGLLREIGDKVETFFDFSEFSMRTVGPSWRNFSPDQKSRFNAAFSELLRGSYIDKLDGYSGEHVNFNGEIANAKGDRVEVQTTVFADGKLIPVNYRMLQKNGAWKVYDVTIERVSLVETYRNQFRDVLARGDAEQLIDRVQARTDQVRQENRAGGQ